MIAMDHTPQNCPMNERMAKLEKRQRRHDRLAEVLFDTDMVGVRVTLAIAEFLWAAMLLWPGDTFDRPTYTLMARVMSETLWGFTFLLTAWAQWSLVMIGDFQCRFARVFAAWNSTLWVFVCGSMYFSVYPPPAAISGESALALGASWIFLRPLVLKGAKA